MDKMVSVISWFSDNSGVINKNGICMKAMVDPNNFRDNLNKGVILEKHLDKIINVISNIGYNSKYQVRIAHQAKEPISVLDTRFTPEELKKSEFENKRFSFIIESQEDYEEYKRTLLPDRKLSYTTFLEFCKIETNNSELLKLHAEISLANNITPKEKASLIAFIEAKGTNH